MVFLAVVVEGQVRLEIIVMQQMAEMAVQGHLLLLVVGHCLMRVVVALLLMVVLVLMLELVLVLALACCRPW